TVERHVQAGVARVLYQTEHAAGAARRGRAVVEVRDVDGNVAAPADVEGLAEGIEELVAEAVAYVGVVDAAEPGRFPGQLRELRRVGVAAGRVIEAGRHPPGSLLHGGPQQRLLIRHLVSRGGPVVPAHGADAQRRVANDVGDVDGHAPREHV